MNIVAAEAGFALWDQARTVLGGKARLGDDRGDFWCETESSAFLNHWYADYALAPDDAVWLAMGRDLVAAYGSAAADRERHVDKARKAELTFACKMDVFQRLDPRP